MIKKFLLAAIGMVTLGTALPAGAQQGDRRERDSRYEQRHDRGEMRRGRPYRDQMQHHPGRYNDRGRYHNDRHYRGRYYNNGYYYKHRYRHHGGWRYR
jgi:hypothetical protein